jgi:hypothetical protein
MVWAVAVAARAVERMMAGRLRSFIGLLLWR